MANEDEVMTEMETFPGWLQTQGLTSETAQAVIMELGIENLKVLRACTESDALRAELISCAQQKFPFAMYTEFHQLMESCVKPGAIQSASSSSAHIFCLMLEHVGDRLSGCAQKLRLLKSSLLSAGVRNAQLHETDIVSEIRIHEVYSLQPNGSKLNPNSGEDDLQKATAITPNTRKSVIIKHLDVASTQVSSNISDLNPGENCSAKVESLQEDNDPSASEALRCTSVKEEIDDHGTDDSVACCENGAQKWS